MIKDITFAILGLLVALTVQSAAEQAHAIDAPVRRIAPGPSVAPPELPAGAEFIDTITFTSPAGRITRSADRVVVQNSRREWWFERNPVDHRRSAATLIDHESRVLISYAESDLNLALGIRGWADVLALGGDAPTDGASVATSPVDPAVLRVPQDRFPDYRVVDIAEWLEER